MVEIHRHEQLLAQLRNNHPDGLSHSGDEGTAQLSDSGQRVCLSEDQVCDVLVFTPNL